MIGSGSLEIAFRAVIVLNTVWFGLAFHYFSLKAASAARMLVPREQRTSPLFHTLAYAVKFLGGMNFAFACLAALLAVHAAAFSAPQRALLALVIAIAHASQFAMCSSALLAAALAWY